MNHLTDLCEEVYHDTPSTAAEDISTLLESIVSFVSANGYETHWQCELEKIGFTFDKDGEIIRMGFADGCEVKVMSLQLSASYGFPMGATGTIWGVRRKVHGEYGYRVMVGQNIIHVPEADLMVRDTKL